MADRLVKEIRAILDDESLRTNTQMRQEVFRLCMTGPNLYVQLQFDPFGTPFHPAINGKPADVAKWLREMADDIEGLEKENAIDEG